MCLPRLQLCLVLPHVIISPTTLIRIRVVLIPSRLARHAEVVLRVGDTIPTAICIVLRMVRVAWILVIRVSLALLPVFKRLSIRLLLLYAGPLAALVRLVLLLLRRLDVDYLADILGAYLLVSLILGKLLRLCRSLLLLLFLLRGLLLALLRFLRLLGLLGVANLYLGVHLLHFGEVRVHEVAQQHLRVELAAWVRELNVRHAVYRALF